MPSNKKIKTIKSSKTKIKQFKGRKPYPNQKKREELLWSDS